MKIGDKVLVKTNFGIDFPTEIIGETIDEACRSCWVVCVPPHGFFGNRFFTKPSPTGRKLYNVGNMQIWIENDEASE